jgi:viroplasmin and RNaseH domain-containing protein
MGKIANKILKQADANARWYTWSKLEDIAPIENAIRDYETHSTVFIHSVNDKNEYSEIQLIASDGFRRLGTGVNKDNYMVLVNYTGSGKDEEAVGVIVRKNINQKNIKQAKDNNFGVI